MNSPALPFPAVPVSLTAPTFPTDKIRAAVVGAQVTDLVDAAHIGWNHAVSTIREGLIAERVYSEPTLLDVHEAAARVESAKVAQLLDAATTAVAALDGVAQSSPAASGLLDARQRLADAVANFSRGAA